MTDVQTAGPEVTAPETPAAPVNDMVTVVGAKLANCTNEANALVSKLNSANSDTKALVHQIRDDADNEVGSADPVVQEWRTFLEAAQAEIEEMRAKADEHIVANLLPKADEDFDADKAKAQYQDLKKTIVAGKQFLTKMFGDDALKGVDIPDLKSLRGGTSTGTGSKRPRLANVWINDAAQSGPWARIFDSVDDGKGGKREVSTFSLLAKTLSGKDYAGVKVEPTDIQSAAFAAAGTDDLSTKPGEVIEFAYSPDEGKHTWQVRVQPKDTDE